MQHAANSNVQARTSGTRGSGPTPTAGHRLSRQHLVSISVVSAHHDSRARSESERRRQGESAQAAGQAQLQARRLQRHASATATSHPMHWRAQDDQDVTLAAQSPATNPRSSQHRLARTPAVPTRTHAHPPTTSLSIHTFALEACMRLGSAQGSNPDVRGLGDSHVHQLHRTPTMWRRAPAV